MTVGISFQTIHYDSNMSIERIYCCQVCHTFFLMKLQAGQLSFMDPAFCISSTFGQMHTLQWGYSMVFISTPCNNIIPSQLVNSQV